MFAERGAVIVKGAQVAARRPGYPLIGVLTGSVTAVLLLRDAGSPWADVLDSVSATLPPLPGDQRHAVARLAAEGPPEEKVGLLGGYR